MAMRAAISPCVESIGCAPWGLVPALLRLLGMQVRKSHLLFLGVLVVAALSWYVGGSELEPRLASLASQPQLTTAFRDTDTGKSDALMTLISFSLLTPLAVFVAVMLVVLLVKAIETVLVSLRAPGWPSVPLVGASLLVALYVTSESWMPSSLYALGLVARAYFVYCYGALPAIH